MNNIETLFLDIEEGNDQKVYKILEELGIDARDSYLRTPLINATFYGKIGLMRWLIEKGADVDAQDKNGYTALHFAAQEVKPDCIQILLDHNANPNIKDVHGNTPAWVAVMNWKAGKNFDSLFKLVQANADLKIRNNANRNAYDIIPDSIKQKLGVK
ncbi:MAG: ankyrin repeat domain-containing protein [Saprospiraceae bacterium]